MGEELRGLGIILHSGSYDRLLHGISIGLAALALGRKVKLFFTYWALEYLKRRNNTVPEKKLHGEENIARTQFIEENVRRGNLESLSELITQGKALGAEFYACTNSMSILNIARDELIEEVNRPMGLTTFLSETAEYQLLFI